MFISKGVDEAGVFSAGCAWLAKGLGILTGLVEVVSTGPADGSMSGEAMWKANETSGLLKTQLLTKYLCKDRAVGRRHNTTTANGDDWANQGQLRNKFPAAIGTNWSN